MPVHSATRGEEKHKCLKEQKSNRKKLVLKWQGKSILCFAFLNHGQDDMEINAALHTSMWELSRLLKCKRRTDKGIKVFSPTDVFF